MIKAIIFDCFGVLTGDLWKEFVGSLPESQKSQARSLNHALDSGLLSQTDSYQAIHILTGHSPQHVEDIITSEKHKNKALLSYIALLSKDYKVGILSNVSSDWITRTFLSKEEIGYFTDMVFSYQIGVTKPDARAFELTAARLGEEPEACIFIDDSQGNCEGAERIGMHAILYEDFETLKAKLKSMLI